MNPEQIAAGLTVTQEDREAAARWARANSRKMQAANIRRGACDTSPLVQAFARHRIAQSKADAARIAALEDALRFYARPQSWRSSGVYMSGRSQATAAEIDGGERARAALETTP